VLDVEDWAEIRRLWKAERMPIKVIARVLGCSKNTVKKALAADAPPAYRRPARGSVVDAVEPRIRELLQATPTMPATVIAERIGWPYSIRVLSVRVAELRPVYLPPDPSSRTAYQAGEIAQCDFWFPPISVPVGFGQCRPATRLPVLTMITGYARWVSALLIPSRAAEDLFAGWWRLLAALGGVPRVLVWDGEGAIGRWRARKPELTEACQGFRGVLGAKVLVCKPADPEAKGGIERFHDYLETSFLPGRRFTSPADFNTQLTAWLQLANSRPKRSLGCAPAERIGADREAMLGLPPVPPAAKNAARAAASLKPRISEAWNRWSVGLSCATFGVSQPGAGQPRRGKPREVSAREGVGTRPFRKFVTDELQPSADETSAPQATWPPPSPGASPRPRRPSTRVPCPGCRAFHRGPACAAHAAAASVLGSDVSGCSKVSVSSASG
jgi:transposase